VSVDPAPPLQPPQLSPDGRYVWDGSQWQPIADPAQPVHKGVFAAWNSIQVDPADPVAEPAQPVTAQAQMQTTVQAPVQVIAPASEVDYGYTVDEPLIPLWQQPTRSGKTTYLYVGAGLVAVVMAVVLLNSFNVFQMLAWPGSGSVATSLPSPKPSPTVDRTRSEFGRADRFVNGSLAPAMAGLTETLPGMKTCNGNLSNSCFDAMTSTDPELKKVLSVIDHATIPLCISAPVKNLRTDLVNMEVALQLALKGYKDNQRGEVVSGAYQFARQAQAMDADARAVDQAQKTQCSTDLEGP